MEPNARVIHYPNVPDTIGVRMDVDLQVEYRLSMKEADLLRKRLGAALQQAKKNNK